MIIFGVKSAPKEQSGILWFTATPDFVILLLDLWHGSFDVRWNLHVLLGSLRYKICQTTFQPFLTTIIFHVLHALPSVHEHPTFLKNVLQDCVCSRRPCCWCRRPGVWHWNFHWSRLNSLHQSLCSRMRYRGRWQRRLYFLVRISFRDIFGSSNDISTSTDLTCVCTNTEFQTAAATCLQDKCTADEQAAALALQQQQCANVSGCTLLAISLRSFSHHMPLFS